MKMRTKSMWISMLSCIMLSGNAADMPLKDFGALNSWHAWRGGKIAAGTEQSILLNLPGTMERVFSYTKQEEAQFGNFQGISFRAKGDGGRHTVYLTVRTKLMDRTVAYTAPFLIEGKEWQTCHAAWSDFINESWDADMILNAPGGIPVSAVLWRFTLGNHCLLTHANQRLPRYNVEFADMKLLQEAEPRIFRNDPPPSLKSVLEKMKRGEKVLIYCHGDSITAGTGVGTKRYPVLLEKMLQEHFKNKNISVRTIAVGGARTIDLRVSAEADFTGDETPDLVTLMLGFNDKTAARPKEWFQASMNDLIDRISHFTKGKTCILLMTTIPGSGPRFATQDNYADTVRTLAEKRGLPCFDMAAIFRPLGQEGVKPYFKDIAHPNIRGHELLASGLMKYLLGNL